MKCRVPPALIRWSRKSAVVLATAMLGPFPGMAAPIGLDGPACFTRSDNAALTFELIQQAPPPRAGTKAYPFYPLTGVTTMQLGTLGQSAGGYARYYFQWSNRSNAPILNARGKSMARKPNFQAAQFTPRKQRTAFSSVDRANACTLAQTATLLGQGTRAARTADDAGIRLISETAQVDAGMIGPADVCVTAQGRLPRDATGVLLDYEVQDKRSGDQTLSFLRTYTALVHAAGYKAILLLDPLDAPSQVYNGIDAQNAYDIAALFDQTTLFLWSRNRQHDLLASYQSQKAMIAQGGKFDGARFLIDYELAGTDLDDARLVRRLIGEDRLAGVLLWRNYAQQGGPCGTATNMKIALLALGHLK